MKTKYLYSTQKNLTTKPPKLDSKNICGKYHSYPKNRKYARQNEGGLRTNGKYKHSKPNRPLITVCTTVRNAVDSIEKCILSVLEQNYDNVEYIIVDAYSTDGTLEIIKKYEDAIDYFVSEKDDSLAQGLNKCLNLANGDAIIEICADNYFEANVFAEYVQEISKKDISLVYAFQYYADANKNIVGINTATFDTIFFSSIAHETVLIKKELVNKIGYYNTTYPLSITTEFMLKIFFLTTKNNITLIKKPTITYFGYGLSHTSLAETRIGDLEIYYQLLGKKININKEYLSYLIWNIKPESKSFSKSLPNYLRTIEQNLIRLIQLEVPEKYAYLKLEFIKQFCLNYKYFDYQENLRKLYVTKISLLWLFSKRVIYKFLSITKIVNFVLFVNKKIKK